MKTKVTEKLFFTTSELVIIQEISEKGLSKVNLEIKGLR